MSESSQCDLFCPRKALLGAVYREDSAAVSPLRRAALAAALGIKGVAQMTIAANCPQRNEPAATWTPRSECADDVRAAIAARPLDPTMMTDYEHKVLDPYMPPTRPDEQ